MSQSQRSDRNLPAHFGTVAACLVSGLLLLTGCASDKGSVPANAHMQLPDPAVYPLISDETGIAISSVYLSSAGYMVDVRYRVTDVERAKQFVTRQIKPVLIDEATGDRFRVPIPPKVGELRHTGAKLGTEKTYFMMFANPGRMIRPGQQLAIELGDARINGLIVQ